MALRIVTEPSALPVALAESKIDLRLDSTVEDSRVTQMIETATKLCEQAVGRAIMPQTLELTLVSFPACLELTRVPVQSVASIIYVDSTGTSQTLSPGTYELDNSDDYGFALIVPAYGGSWPATRDQPRAVRVQYIAGYPDASKVPQPIKNWIRAMVVAMHQNPAAFDSKETFKVGYLDGLLDAYKVYQV